MTAKEINRFIAEQAMNVIAAKSWREVLVSLFNLANVRCRALATQRKSQELFLFLQI